MLATRALRALSAEAAGAHLPPNVLKLNDLVAERGEGSTVFARDPRSGQQRALLDFSTGIGVLSTGHSHPRVVEAVREQAGRLVHAQQNCFGSHEPQLDLLEELSRVVPAPLSRFFFANSGSEAVDNAIKIARAHTGRPNIIAFEGGFHGRTIGAMSLTSSKTSYRQGFQPLMPGAFITLYPNCLRCPVRGAKGGEGYTVAPYVDALNCEERSCCYQSLYQLEMMMKEITHPSETAAVIVEPILGEGGFLTPPPDFLRRVRELCSQHGILLIIDEVQAGAGRTGRWWGHQHWEGVDPDIMLFAKGIASGYPLAGLATKPAVMENLVPGTLGGTYGGNALASAAAAETIRVIRDEDLLGNAHARGEQLMRGLLGQAGLAGSPIVDIRGRGLMVGVEFSDAVPEGFAARVSQECLKRDMLLLTAGCHETVRFLPPLNVSAEEVDQALEVFSGAVAAASG